LKGFGLACNLDCWHWWETYSEGKTRRFGNGISWGKGINFLGSSYCYYFNYV